MKRGMAVGMAILAGVAAACKPGETPQQRQDKMAAEADSARTAIHDGVTRWVRYVNQNHGDSISTLFSTNGVMMPPDMPGVTGHDSINAANRALTIPGGELSITSRTISVSDPIAVDRGVWSYSLPAQGRTAALTMHGKYLAHWHHTVDGWRIDEITWNNDDTVRPPMPAAPR